MITITDGQTDIILDDITEDAFWNDKHYKSLKENLETFDFTTFADKPFSEHLEKKNRVIIPGEDGEFIEFIIQNTRKYRNTNGGLFMDVYTYASYIELRTAKVIRPQTLQGATAKSAAEFAVAGTEWQVGQVDYAGIRTIPIENHTNPYSLLKQIASKFGLELRFHIEHDGNQITGRYVDLIERVGDWKGREVEFGKDLLGIERKEDTSNVVTALIGLGPEREDGTRLEVFVEDKEALVRWGRNGQHIIDIYEPESTDTEMTESRLRELTQNELEKRVNSVVEYVGDIADLEKVPGLEHEKIRFGDTIKIKDTGFNPPLYLEARVHTQERSIKKSGRKTVVLGDYIEYTEEEIKAIWRSLQAQIAKKISMADVLEVTYTKAEIDEKDIPGKEAKAKIDRDVGEAIIETTDGSQDKADQAERNAKNHADNVANQARQEAITEAVNQAQQALSNAVNELETSIAEKADAEWVNGQLVLKENAITKSNTAPASPTAGQLWLDTSVTPNVLKRWDGSAWVKATPTSAGEVGAYTKTEVDNALNSKVSVTQYTADMNGVVARLDSAESRITQNENEIATKVSLTQYQQDQEDLSSQLSQMSTQIQQQADQIALKANKTDVYTKTQVDQELGKKVDTTVYNQKIGELTTSIDGISANVSNLQTTVGQHGTSISNLQSQVNIQAGQIASKVDATYVQGAIADIQIGGRNLEPDSHFDGGSRNGWGHTGYFDITVENSIAIFECKLTHAASRLEKVFSDLKVGEVYTLTIFADLPKRIEWSGFINANILSQRYLEASPGKFKTYSVTFEATGSDVTVRGYMPNLDIGTKAYMDWYKLEKGNKATDWTPAPEDVQSEIDNVYEYASSEIQQLAGEVSTKAEASTVTAIGNRVTTAEQNISALQGQINQKVSITEFNALGQRVSTAEQNISALQGEITTKVSKTDYNGETIVSLIHQTAEQVTISANKINFRGHVFGEDATFTGHLQGASGTFGQVSVNDGDFSLRESSSGLEQSIIAKENLIMDHSFEMLVGHGDFDYNYFWHEYDSERPDNKRHAYWISVGAPKIGVYLPSPNVNTVSFGMQNICVNLNNYVYQDVEAYKLEAGATYTISAFFRRQRNTTAGARPRIRLRFMDLADQIVLWDGGITTFDAVPSNYNHVRYAKTFTLPQSLENEMIVTRGLRVDIQTTDGKWVAVDGVQLVKNDKPVIYDPETSFFQLISGRLGYGFNGGIRFNNSQGAEFDKFGNLQAPATAATLASWNIKDFYEDVVFSVPWGTTKGLPVEIRRDLRTTGVIYTPAIAFTSITSIPINREGAIWYGDGYQGKGLYVHYPSGWAKL